MAAITDQSIAELTASLRPRREWAKTVTGWRKPDALREIREYVDELAARGISARPRPKVYESLAQHDSVRTARQPYIPISTTPSVGGLGYEAGPRRAQLPAIMWHSIRSEP